MLYTMHAPKIALIHALAHSVAPVNDAFAREWPEARLMNLLDDSLSADLALASGLDAAMNQRFETLAAYALDQGGAQAILFTCSAFGPCIEAVARARPHVPILKPNEAMVAEATRRGGALGLVATFGRRWCPCRPSSGRGCCSTPCWPLARWTR